MNHLNESSYCFDIGFITVALSDITRYLSETLKEEALSVHAENERATLVRRVTILFPDDSLLPVISRPYLDMNGRSQKQERLRKLLEEINAVDSNISELSDSYDGESDYCEENDHQSDSEQSDCDLKSGSPNERRDLGPQALNPKSQGPEPQEPYRPGSHRAANAIPRRPSNLLPHRVQPISGPPCDVGFWSSPVYYLQRK
uniref:Uncharacterized protein n=1 Tax=Timema tahoe TaxID=61484 RepID=A0A7R9IA58_9NEOP|nr:unnamed protein product [Timema tahoe]